MSMKQVSSCNHIMYSGYKYLGLSQRNQKAQRLYCERKLTGNGDSFCKELLSVNVK